VPSEQTAHADVLYGGRGCGTEPAAVLLPGVPPGSFQTIACLPAGCGCTLFRCCCCSHFFSLANSAVAARLQQPYAPRYLDVVPLGGVTGLLHLPHTRIRLYLRAACQRPPLLFCRCLPSTPPVPSTFATWCCARTCHYSLPCSASVSYATFPSSGSFFSCGCFFFFFNGLCGWAAPPASYPALRRGLYSYNGAVFAGTPDDRSGGIVLLALYWRVLDENMAPLPPSRALPACPASALFSTGCCELVHGVSYNAVFRSGFGDGDRGVRRCTRSCMTNGDGLGAARPVRRRFVGRSLTWRAFACSGRCLLRRQPLSLAWRGLRVWRIAFRDDPAYYPALFAWACLCGRAAAVRLFVACRCWKAVRSFHVALVRAWWTTVLAGVLLCNKRTRLAVWRADDILPATRQRGAPCQRIAPFLVWRHFHMPWVTNAARQTGMRAVSYADKALRAACVTLGPRPSLTRTSPTRKELQTWPLIAFTGRRRQPSSTKAWTRGLALACHQPLALHPRHSGRHWTRRHATTYSTGVENWNQPGARRVDDAA